MSRLLKQASCIALLWLMSATFAQAATGPGRPNAGPLCDTTTTTLKKLLRHTKSFGGPLARHRMRALYGLTDLTAKLRRGTHTTLGDETAAIQNDAPAAHTGADDHLLPTLRPLGTLIGSVERRPCTGTFSPRAPRGPPLAA
jgi:hypothetical protein